MPKFNPKISVIDAAQRLRSDTITELSGIYRTEEKIYYSERQSSIYTIQKPANDLTIASLIPFILVNTSLHSVDFSFTNIAINGYYIRLLLALVEREKPFKTINFSFTNLFTIPFHKYDKLKNFFRTIHCEELYLSSCGITTAMLYEIIDAIACNPWLKKLDLSHNHLKNTGVIHIAEKLIIPNFSNISAIESLAISYNGHGNMATMFIQKALEKNHVIKNLFLTHTVVNPFKHYKIDKAISKLLDRNRTLAEFRLEGQEKLTSFPVAGFFLLTFAGYFLQDTRAKHFPSVLISLIFSYLDNVGRFDSLTDKQKETIFGYMIDHKPGAVLNPKEFKQYFQRHRFFDEKKNLKQPKEYSEFEKIDVEKSNYAVSL